MPAVEVLETLPLSHTVVDAFDTAIRYAVWAPEILQLKRGKGLSTVIGFVAHSVRRLDGDTEALPDTQASAEASASIARIFETVSRFKLR